MSWGSDQPGFRQVYDAGSCPTARSSSGERSTSCSDDRRHHATPTGCGAPSAISTAPRRHGQLDVPMLILHSDDDRVWAFDEAEELQAMVPGSRLVRLPSNNHILQAEEPAFATFIDEVERFLSSDEATSHERCAGGCDSDVLSELQDGPLSCQVKRDPAEEPRPSDPPVLRAPATARDAHRNEAVESSRTSSTAFRKLRSALHLTSVSGQRPDDQHVHRDDDQ